MTQLSLITVNYRSWAHLENLLGDLDAAPELADGRWEVIVVDNNSGDGKIDTFKARYPGVSFVANSGNFGFSHGNNLGARRATGEKLLFVNPDVRIELPAVRSFLQEKNQHPEFALLTAMQTDQNGRAQKVFDFFPDLLTYLRSIRGLLRLMAPARYPDARRQRDELIACDWISGSLLLIDRVDFEELGGWCEDFWMYAEDMDICRRAADMGKARACTSRCRFVHLHGGASRRDTPTSLLTKTEVMISAHVYISRHFRSLHQWLNHIIVALRNLLPLGLAAIFNLISLGKIGGLRRRGVLFTRMLAYYSSALRHKTWLSPRSVNYPAIARAES